MAAVRGVLAAARVQPAISLCHASGSSCEPGRRGSRRAGTVRSLGVSCISRSSSGRAQAKKACRLGAAAAGLTEWEGLCRFGSPSSGAGLVPHFAPCGLGLEGNARRRSSVRMQAGNNSINAPERILAALGYVLPFFDGIQYGRYFFMQFPIAESLIRPLFPLLSAYKGFPFSNFIAFFSLYLFVVRNPSFSRYVRFNAMQAVVLDVLLILPTLVERTFAPRGGIGFELLIIFYNTVFLFLVACFLFGVFSCLLGKTPRLPVVADAADAQV